MASIILPRVLEVGAGAMARLPAVLQGLGCRNPLIVTDRMMAQLGYLEHLRGLLAEAGLGGDVFADTLPEPTAASLEGGLAMVRDGDYDAVVALGGGSPIDSAKAR